MELFEAIFNRRAIRQYDSDFQLPEADLMQILKAGMYAPSAMNKRPWDFIVVNEKSLLKKVESIHPYAAFLHDAGTGIIVCENLAEAYSEMGMIDVSLASQNIMLAAHALGYGSCYCGVFPDHSDDFSELFDLPDHIRPIGLIVIGKPLKTPQKPERFEEEKIHINQF